MAKTYREVLSWASSFLEEKGIDGHHILYVLLGRKNWSKTDWFLNWQKEIPEQEQVQVQKDLERLAQHYPPQYLLGFEVFYDRRFQVSEATLIPRPETEELVALCLETCQTSTAYVVDVGTGSGAIGLSLKLERPTWEVACVDLSAEALAIAKQNGRNLQADVAFYLGDTLAPITREIDILLSNPPYIAADEWQMMDESVRSFEPKLALFAANEGLAMYQKLATEAREKLAPSGKIFLEIGYQQGKAVQSLFQAAFPEKKVTIRPDLSGLDRIVVVE
ncbi:peptide chain release factor N(5)-glutamine methyltransferase [Enterococcus sp. LJL98]